MQIKTKRAYVRRSKHKCPICRLWFFWETDLFNHLFTTHYFDLKSMEYEGW